MFIFLPTLNEASFDFPPEVEYLSREAYWY